MRRPRAGFASLHSGGPGTRSGGTTTPPQGACWTGTVPKVSDGPRRDKPMRRTGAAAYEETGTETRKRGPGEQKSPRWRAERRHTFARRCAHVEWPRRLARHPLDILSGGDSPGPPVRGGRKRNTAYPGPQRIRAAERWLAAPTRSEDETLDDRTAYEWGRSGLASRRGSEKRCRSDSANGRSVIALSAAGRVNPLSRLSLSPPS